MKKFKLSTEQIVRLVDFIGAATATDMITVEGKGVGYMYRDEPINDIDSGWRFFSGDEDKSYVDNSDNTGFYDVNTVANYDPAIVAYLDKPVGSAWERVLDTEFFQEVK